MLHLSFGVELGFEAQNYFVLILYSSELWFHKASCVDVVNPSGVPWGYIKEN